LLTLKKPNTKREHPNPAHGAGWGGAGVPVRTAAQRFARAVGPTVIRSALDIDIAGRAVGANLAHASAQVAGLVPAARVGAAGQPRLGGEVGR